MEEAPLWAWLRAQIIANPKKAATMLGIEEIGYLADLKAPQPSPTLTGLADQYAGKPDCLSMNRPAARIS